MLPTKNQPPTAAALLYPFSGRRQTQTCSGRNRLLVCLWHLPEIQCFNKHLRRRAWLVFPIQPARSRNATPHPRAQPLPVPTGATQVIAISEISWLLSATQAPHAVYGAGWCLFQGLSILGKELLVFCQCLIFKNRYLLVFPEGKDNTVGAKEAKVWFIILRKPSWVTLKWHSISTPISYLKNENSSCLDWEVCWKDTG